MGLNHLADQGAACEQSGITHKFTRAYRPQTNGKAQRLIQSALREGADGWTYQNSAERRQTLHSGQHHYNGTALTAASVVSHQRPDYRGLDTTS